MWKGVGLGFVCQTVVQQVETRKTENASMVAKGFGEGLVSGAGY